MAVLLEELLAVLAAAMAVTWLLGMDFRGLGAGAALGGGATLAAGGVAVATLEGAALGASRLGARRLMFEPAAWLPAEGAGGCTAVAGAAGGGATAAGAGAATAADAVWAGAGVTA